MFVIELQFDFDLYYCIVYLHVLADFGFKLLQLCFVVVALQIDQGCLHKVQQCLQELFELIGELL